MQLTALTTLFEPGNADAFVKAAARSVKPDQAAIDRLCDRLTGIEFDDVRAIAKSLIDFPMPPGFLHARVFDAADGMEMACVLARNGKNVTAGEVSLLVTLSDRFLDGRWVETSPLPIRDPGVLDLLVRFEPRN